ncbi:putative capsular polysaccharide synthesis family protein [Rossellomorea sp. AcN35-11]|nr:putative capsular polysaccharide synthesis family protein [Rossellomorea aquimaris]WJV30821.1 putative capsular polysaccharide synthesis family protein [Rossellomorea sp. AcN35-11]
MNKDYLIEKIGVIGRKITEFKNFYRAIIQKEVILIYQMGKVGSSSLYYSLNEQSEKPIIHIHNFYNVSKDTKFARKFYIRIKISFLNFILKRKKLKVISFVREPVSRNLSCFFQNLDHYTNIENSRPNQIIKTFEEKYDHKYTLNWVQEELCRKFNIDIFSLNFDKKRGFSIYEKNNTKIFIGKLETLNSYIAELKDFINFEFEYKNFNEGDNKWYSDLYKEAKKDYKPTNEYLESMYQSQYMNFFYTKEEIEKFKSKFS